MADMTKPMDEEEKKKKSKFSFLRMIGLDSDKNNTSKQEDVPNSNKFYVGNVETAVRNKKKKLDEITGN